MKRKVKAKATERRRDKGLGSIPMRLVEVINASEILARVAPTVGMLGYPQYCSSVDYLIVVVLLELPKSRMTQQTE